MKKIGGSVLKFVLQDKELSDLYSTRIIVRDPSKPAVRELESKGVEVAEADFDDEDRLKVALKGVHTVFVLTSYFATLSKDKEIEQSKKIADIAVAQGVEFLIYSSLPSAAKVSSGKLTEVHHFESKATSEEYIRQLPIKSAFYLPGVYLQNFLAEMGPQPAGDGTFVLTNIVNPDTGIPMLDVQGDSGKYVGSILAQPENFTGQQVWAAGEIATYPDVAENISKVTGKKVVYQQISDEKYKSFWPETLKEEMTQMFMLFRDYSLYGKDQKTKMAADAKAARQAPTSLKDFFANHKAELDKALQ